MAPMEVRYLPAIKGRGVFATQAIAKGTLIGEYGGVLRVENPVGDIENKYVLATDFSYRNKSLIVDAEKSGNFSRFLNHSSGAIEQLGGVNVLFIDLVLDGRPLFAIFAARDILPNEQLLFDYGEGYWQGLGIDPKAF